MSSIFNIVLVAPEIPQNTGNIGRLCVSTNTRLHLIKPLGFSIDDKAVKRSGLDYWKYLDLIVYENWQEFEKLNKNETFYFFSTKTEKTLWDCPYKNNSFLIFGNEGSGLPPKLYKQYKKELYTIPMRGKHSRSLNIANSVSIALFEGIRKQGIL